MNNSAHTINPHFIPDPEQTSDRVYSNYVAVSHTGLDFTLTFLDVPPPTKKQIEDAKNNKPIATPMQCQVVVPNHLVPSLIEALQKQYETFTKSSQNNT